VTHNETGSSGSKEVIQHQLAIMIDLNDSLIKMVTETVNLEARSEEDEKNIVSVMPEIRSNISTILSLAVLVN